jgi:hypothetical protein
MAEFGACGDVVCRGSVKDFRAAFLGYSSSEEKFKMPGFELTSWFFLLDLCFVENVAYVRGGGASWHGITMHSIPWLAGYNSWCLLYGV